MAYCEACEVASNPVLARCPLCDGPLVPMPEERTFPSPAMEDGKIYPSSPGEAGAVDRRARVDRFARLSAFGLSGSLVALNLLTAPASSWSLHPVSAILAMWACWRLPRSMPRPRANYVILMVEIMVLSWLGATAFLGGSAAWFVSYVFPAIAMAGATAIGIVVRMQSHPFKKAYAPLLWSLLVALVPLPAAILAPGSPDRVFPGILFALSGAAIAWLARKSRRWIRSELKRKLAR